jgi:hypothetical protein
LIGGDELSTLSHYWDPTIPAFPLLSSGTIYRRPEP